MDIEFREKIEFKSEYLLFFMEIIILQRITNKYQVRLLNISYDNFYNTSTILLQ